MKSEATRERPTVRPSGRVILLDEDERILLICMDGLNGLFDDPSFWITPGGGVRPGETFEEAALRELWEETGIQGVQLSVCVWERRHVYRFGEDWVESHDRFFVARVEPCPRIEPQRLDPIEVEGTREYRWWSLPELEAATDQIFVPRTLAALLPPILRGELPAEPITFRDP